MTNCDIDGLQAEFDSLVKILDLSTDGFDMKSPALLKTTRYVRRTLDDANRVVEGKEARATQGLKRCFLTKLENPWLTAEEVDVISHRLQIDAKTVRVFFKNQRKRYVSKMQAGLKEDLDKILQQGEDVDGFINGYFRDIARGGAEPQSSPQIQPRREE
jgi:hypothetical protein